MKNFFTGVTRTSMACLSWLKHVMPKKYVALHIIRVNAAYECVPPPLTSRSFLHTKLNEIALQNADCRPRV
eukprot:2836905-Pleurochrysis_carterae.AAC.2